MGRESHGNPCCLRDLMVMMMRRRLEYLKPYNCEKIICIRYEYLKPYAISSTLIFCLYELGTCLTKWHSVGLSWSNDDFLRSRWGAVTDAMVSINVTFFRRQLRNPMNSSLCYTLTGRLNNNSIELRCYLMQCSFGNRRPFHFILFFIFIGGGSASPVGVPTIITCNWCLSGNRINSCFCYRRKTFCSCFLK